MTNIKSSVNGEQIVLEHTKSTNYIPARVKKRKENKLCSVLIHFQDGIHTYLADSFFFLQSLEWSVA